MLFSCLHGKNNLSTKVDSVFFLTKHYLTTIHKILFYKSTYIYIYKDSLGTLNLQFNVCKILKHHSIN